MNNQEVKQEELEMLAEKAGSGTLTPEEEGRLLDILNSGMSDVNDTLEILALKEQLAKTSQ